jgi:hypothetical protein
MKNNTNNGFMLVIISKTKREERAQAIASSLPNFVHDTTYAPIQIDNDMFIVRGRVTGPLKHDNVFSFAPESEMMDLFGEGQDH